MAVTEQQFIQAYSQMDADKQQQAYNAGNAQVKSWIDNYNQTQNTYTTPTTTTIPTTPTSQTTPTPTQTYNEYGNGDNTYNGRDLGNWNYGVDTDERQAQIINNLNAAYTQSPEMFSDWNTFAQNFNYDYSGRSDRERQTMRNWYNVYVGGQTGDQTGQGQTAQFDYNNPGTADYLMGQLIQGTPLTGEGASIDAAKARYQERKVLSGMTPYQIASAVASGAISAVGQGMQDLRSYSPALYAQVQAELQQQTQLDDINAAGESIYTGLSGTETNANYLNYIMSGEYTQNASIIQQYNADLYNKILGLGGDTAAYVAIVASMLQNPAIQGTKNEVQDLEGEINKIKEQIYTIGDTARATLGSEAPEDLVGAYISNQTKQLQNQLRTAQNSLLVAQGKLDNQLSEVDIMIDAINNGITAEKGGMPGQQTVNVVSTGGGTSGGTTAYISTAADTLNYQDDSSARLNQIRQNLENYAKTNPELFADRTTFNNFFKYNQRSAKQKQLLDAAWMKYGKKFGIGSVALTTKPTTQEVNTLANAIKSDILNGNIVSFAAADIKKQYPQYRNNSRGQDASYQVMVQIGEISTWDELQKIMLKVDSSMDTALLDGYWSKESNKTAVVNGIKKIGVGNTSAQRQQIAEYLRKYNLDDDSWRLFLTRAGVSEKNIERILKLK